MANFGAWTLKAKLAGPEEEEEEEEDAEAQPGSSQEERGWAFAKKEPASPWGRSRVGRGSVGAERKARGVVLCSPPTPPWVENSRDSIHSRTDRIPERTQPWKRDDWSVVAL